MKKASKFIKGKESVSRKSSIIFMQLGLVFALLLTYVAIESKTLINDDVVVYDTFGKDDDDNDIIPDTTPKPPKEEKINKKKEPLPILDNPDIIKNNSEENETEIDTKMIDPDIPTKIIDIDDIPEIIIPEKVVEDVPISLVEEMPVFPGCTGNKKELQACLSKKISKLVQRNFNPDIAQDIGLTPGTKRIFVLFVIDKEGNITNIKSNAPHKALQKEAVRVLNKLPRLKPGKLNGKKVGVKYSLPIKYQVME
jgi:protein TonB